MRKGFFFIQTETDPVDQVTGLTFQQRFKPIHHDRLRGYLWVHWIAKTG